MKPALPSVHAAGHGGVLVQAPGVQGVEGRQFQDATIVGSACPSPWLSSWKGSNPTGRM